MRRDDVLPDLANMPTVRPSTSSAYVERVNKAIDFVVRNLGRPVRLREVARAASLSPFHFHRVFQALMGETLGDYVGRRRFDRAVAMMAQTRGRSLTRIALDCGFASSSDFSRGFRRRFGVAPSRFNLEKLRAAHREALEHATARVFHLRELPTPSNPDRFQARLRELPARTVAYIRVRRPYEGDAVRRAADRLMAWAERHGVAGGQWLGYQWENPELVSLDDCQYCVALECEGVTPRGEIGMFRFPAMTVAQVEIRGGIDLELRAMQWLMGVWLPRSGYVPDDQPCFEAWTGRPFAHGTVHFELFAQLPVRPDDRGPPRHRGRRAR